MRKKTKRKGGYAPLTRYSEFSIISTGLINTGAVEQDGHAQNAHPVFREQNRNSLTSNLQSIKMKICGVVPILDTVGHMTNYTWIGPAVIVNLIKILFASYSWYSWSCDHLRLG